MRRASHWFRAHPHTPRWARRWAPVVLFLGIPLGLSPQEAPQGTSAEPLRGLPSGPNLNLSLIHI